MYKPINGWTKAKIVEQIKQRNDGYQSTNKDGGCMYRNNKESSGNACAIGCFIPDDRYEPSMEGRGIRVLLDEFPSLFDYMPLPENALLELQKTHDKFAEDTQKQMIEWVETNVQD